MRLILFVMILRKHWETDLTNFAARWISNDHKPKLYFNFGLALSLSYCPINQMSEVSSPTHRNLILASNGFQLINLIVSRPYMFLMKC